jgi:FkbM family methyltransferase
LKRLRPPRFLLRLLRRPRAEDAAARPADWSAEDEQRLAFYRPFVAAGDLVFDVGANVGNRTRVFLALGARVVAFEPQQACARGLELTFSANPRFTLDTRALGEAAGEQVMHVSDTDVLSTLSADWIAATRRSGRFDAYAWGDRQQVLVTTMDAVIEAYGRPVFVKIDVEGYEYPVIRGLSAPVAALSFEFASEHLDAACRCIDHLAGLASTSFAFSEAESMTLDRPTWRPAVSMKEALTQRVAENPLVWGDVYARADGLRA